MEAGEKKFRFPENQAKRKKKNKTLDSKVFEEKKFKSPKKRLFVANKMI